MDIKDNKFNIGEAFTDNKVIRAAYQKHADLKEVKTEAEIKTIIAQGLVTGIITLLDMASITLQDGRSNVNKGLGKQTTTSTSSPLNKGKRPQV